MAESTLVKCHIVGNYMSWLIYNYPPYLEACCIFQQEEEVGNYVNQEVELFSPVDLLSVARQITLGMVSTVPLISLWPDR